MAPKKNAREATPSPAATTLAGNTTAGPVPKPRAVVSSSAKARAGTWDQVLQNLVDYYMNETPQRTKLIDAFLAFIAVVGAWQFIYCILAGNYVRGPSA